MGGANWQDLSMNSSALRDESEIHVYREDRKVIIECSMVEEEGLISFLCCHGVIAAPSLDPGRSLLGLGS